MHVLALLLLAHRALGQDSDYGGGAPTATIDSATLLGKATLLPDALGPVNQFFGVPFAQSPPERFSPPKPVPAFERPINASEWKPACIQQFRCMYQS